MENKIKIIKIICPYYNGTLKWYKKNRWDIILPNGDKYFIYDENSIVLLRLILKLNEERHLIEKK